MVDSASRPPVPDPTELTTEQMLREVKNAVDLVHSEMQGLKSTIAEQFNSVGTQFALIERQRVEQKKDTKDAVDAALAAAKEAVKEQTTASDRSITKSETAMSEQLKQLNATFTAAIGGATDKISDLQRRIDRGDGQSAGVSTAGGWIVAALTLLVSIAAVAVLIITR